MIKRLYNNQLVFGVVLWVMPIVLYYCIQPFLPYGMPDGDVYLYHRLASEWVGGGKRPFIDYYFEYPPASIFVFALPALVSYSVQSYIVAYQLISWVAYALIAVVITQYHSILRLQGITRHRLFVYVSLCMFVLMPLAVNRFDVFAVLSMVAGTLLFMRGMAMSQSTSRVSVIYRTLGILVIVCGALIKLYPLFLLPFFGLYEIKNRYYKATMFHTVVAGLFLLPFAMWMVYGKQGLEYFITYHGQRGLEIESIWATSIMLMHQLFGVFEYSVVYEFGSFGLAGTGADTMAGLSLYSFIGVLIYALIVFYWRLNKDNQLWLIFVAMVLVSCGFAVLNKVFSAQYAVWFIPFLSIYLSRVFARSTGFIHTYSWRLALGATVGIACATILIFPLAWGMYVDGAVTLTAILALRNLVVLLIVGTTLIELHRSSA